MALNPFRSVGRLLFFLVVGPAIGVFTLGVLLSGGYCDYQVHPDGAVIRVVTVR